MKLSALRCLTSHLVVCLVVHIFVCQSGGLVSGSSLHLAEAKILWNYPHYTTRTHARVALLSASEQDSRGGQPRELLAREQAQSQAVINSRLRGKIIMNICC